MNNLGPKERIAKLASEIVIDGHSVNPLSPGAPPFKGKDGVSMVLDGIRKENVIAPAQSQSISLKRPTVETPGIQRDKSREVGV